MINSNQTLTLNLLAPEKLFCDFNYWSSLFSQDLQFLLEEVDGVPLNNLSSSAFEIIFPFLLLAISEYKISNKKLLGGICLDNLLNLWFDKYSVNKSGFFELNPITKSADIQI